MSSNEKDCNNCANKVVECVDDDCYGEAFKPNKKTKGSVLKALKEMPPCARCGHSRIAHEICSPISGKLTCYAPCGCDGYDGKKGVD